MQKYKLIAYREEVFLYLLGTGTSQSIPFLQDLFKLSQAWLNHTSLGKLCIERLADSMSINVDNELLVGIYRKIMPYLTDELFIGEKYIDQKQSIHNKIFKEYGSDIAIAVLNSLDSIYEEIRLPRDSMNYRYNTSAILHVIRHMEGEGRHEDGILIDMPGSMPYAFDKLVRGSYRFMRDNRIPKKIRDELKIYIPNLEKLQNPNWIPWISTVLYTHSHYDHIAGTDFFRDLYSVLEKPITAYGLLSVLKKLRAISPEFFDTTFYKFDLNKKDQWPQMITDINNQLSVYVDQDVSIFEDRSEKLTAQGYYPILEYIDNEDVENIFNGSISCLAIALKKQIESVSGENKFTQLVNDMLVTDNTSLKDLGVTSIELAIPYGKVLPVEIKADSTLEDGSVIERTGYKGSTKYYKSVNYHYPELSVGKLGTKVIPLDIKHGPDYEKLNDKKRSIPISSTVQQLLDAKSEAGKFSPLNSIVGYLFPEYKVAYITDASHIPDHTLEILKDAKLNHLVINGLWFEKKHPSHLSIKESIGYIKEIGAKKAYLTHLTKGVYMKAGAKKIRKLSKELHVEGSKNESIELGHDRMKIIVKGLDK